MKPLQTFSDRDLKLISAYIDGDLSERKIRQLKDRFEREPELVQAYTRMQEAVQALRRLPTLPAPRNFTLTPEMVGVKTRRTFPVLQFATVLTAIAFTVIVSGDVFWGGGLSGANRMMDAAPAMEMMAEEIEVPKLMEEAEMGAAPAADMEAYRAESRAGDVQTEMEMQPAPMAAVAEEGEQTAQENAVAYEDAPMEEPVMEESLALPEDTDTVANVSGEEPMAMGAPAAGADEFPEEEIVPIYSEPGLIDRVQEFLFWNWLGLLEVILGVVLAVLVGLNLKRRKRY